MLFTIEDIRELLASSALCNPMDSYRGSCTGEVRYAFTQAFEHVLEQGVDWTAVQDEARRVLEVLEEKRRQREKAQEETRLFEVSDFRLFSEWSAASTSRNVTHVLSFFATEGLYECLSTSVRILGNPGLATYCTRVSLFGDDASRGSRPYRRKEGSVFALDASWCALLRRAIPSVAVPDFDSVTVEIRDTGF